MVKNRNIKVILSRIIASGPNKSYCIILPIGLLNPCQRINAEVSVNGQDALGVIGNIYKLKYSKICGKVKYFGVKKAPEFFHKKTDLTDTIFCGLIQPKAGSNHIGKILFRVNQVILFSKTERENCYFEFDIVSEFFDSKKLLALNLRVLKD